MTKCLSIKILTDYTNKMSEYPNTANTFSREIYKKIANIVKNMTKCHEYNDYFKYSDIISVGILIEFLGYSDIVMMNK